MKTVEGKVVILGAQGVGKTTVIHRYITKNSSPSREKPTIAASFFTCHVNLEEVRVKMQVWDTAGQERFRSMAPMYYRNANAALLVFDLTDKLTFEVIKSWVVELRRNVDDAMVLVVVGNKCDLIDERVISTDEGEKYATSIGATYYETSAVHSDGGVEQVFRLAAKGLAKVGSNIENSMSSLRVYNSYHTGLNSLDEPASPSSEDSLANKSIAHGINETPWMCC